MKIPRSSIWSDTVTSDLAKFKIIQPGGDHHFSKLVNLVRRSYNILKEETRYRQHPCNILDREKDDQR
ncbi:Hypothetical predicted protein [Paramuricea clavata]|uniref:Uncharacterized protein n=1 Tax=Paramuricea clavata TaxID=317549 RepID=A0A7D9JQ78_PARCT|nr:Hypothetical predicted protein [Paramuricea clavata]